MFFEFNSKFVHQVLPAILLLLVTIMQCCYPAFKSCSLAFLNKMYCSLYYNALAKWGISHTQFV